MAMFKEANKRGYTGPYLSNPITYNPMSTDNTSLGNSSPSYPATETVVTHQSRAAEAVPAAAMFVHNPVVLTMNSIGITLLGNTMETSDSALNPQSSNQIEVTPVATATQVVTHTPVVFTDPLPYTKA
jgi:hypothetical protein